MEPGSRTLFNKNSSILSKIFNGSIRLLTIQTIWVQLRITLGSNATSSTISTLTPRLALSSFTFAVRPSAEAFLTLLSPPKSPSKPKESFSHFSTDSMANRFLSVINLSHCLTSSTWPQKMLSTIWPTLSHKWHKRILITSTIITNGSRLGAHTQARCQPGSDRNSLTSLLVRSLQVLSFWLLKTLGILTNKFTFQLRKVAISALKQFRKWISMLKIKFWAITESPSSHNSRLRNWQPENSCFTGLMWLFFLSNTEKDRHSVDHFRIRLWKRLLTSSRTLLRKCLQPNMEPTTWKIQSLLTKKAAAPDHGFTKAALNLVTSKPSQCHTRWDPRCLQLTSTEPGVKTSLDKELGHSFQELITSLED